MPSYPYLRKKIHPRVTGATPEKLDRKLEEIDTQISRTNNLRSKHRVTYMVWRDIRFLSRKSVKYAG